MLNPPSPELLDRLRARLGPAAFRDPAALHDRAARALAGQGPGDRPGQCRRDRRHCPRLRRSTGRHRALWRRHRAGRRAGPVRRAANRSCCRSSGWRRSAKPCRRENVLIAEAGAILADVQAAAEAAGRLFPLSLASEGSARIGGLLSTNAGGVNVLRYGNGARALPRAGGGAARRLGLERADPAAQGQHRLRPARPADRGRGHARHHHRRGAAAVPRARPRKAPPCWPCRRPPRRSTCWRWRASSWARSSRPSS